MDPNLNLNFGESSVYTTNTIWGNEGIDGSSPDFNYTLDLDAIFGTPQIPQLDSEKKIYGKAAHLQYFYEGPKKCTCCINWVEKEPITVPESAKVQYDNAAVHIYKAKDHDNKSSTRGGVMAIDYSAIVIQSQIIIDQIRPILSDIGLQLPESGKTKFTPPFNELYFAHPRIKDLQRKYPEFSDESIHLKLLVDLLEKIFSETSLEVAELHQKKVISCRYIWTVFPKGILVYSRVNGKDRIFQVIDVRSKMLRSKDIESVSEWKITCRYVTFDGVKFGMAHTRLTIPAFRGVRNILSLPVYPLSFHGNPTLLQQRLLARAEQVVGFRETAHREYNGIAYSQPLPDGQDEDVEYRRGEKNSDRGKVLVVGRVIIDHYAFWKFNPESDEAVELEPLELQVNLTPEMEKQRAIEQTEALEFATEGRPTQEKLHSTLARLRERRQFLLIMSPLVPGYSLKLNKWLWFYVDTLQPVQESGAGFDHLVFQKDQKDLVLTFVENHNQSTSSADDVIAGKGQGLTLLLSGPPGTGKTLTAESVAEKIRRPLIHLLAEELGSGVSEIGRNLSEILDLAMEWNAILLLDEADTFLTKRSADGDSRNNLVAVFLRQLEYYRGIIFLTTNLLNNIDEAFRSRVQIHLCYPKLSLESRRELWIKFFARLSVSSPSKIAYGKPRHPTADLQANNGKQYYLTPHELSELSLWELNGREIKNVTKTVHLWCSYKKSTLTLSRIEAAIKVTSPLAIKLKNAAVGGDGEGDDRPRKRTRQDVIEG